MPEEHRKTIDDESPVKTSEIEDSRQVHYSNLQKMLNIVKDFFNRRSTNDLGSKPANNRCSRQTEISKNSRNSPRKNSVIENENNRSRNIINGSSTNKHFRTHRYQDNEKVQDKISKPNQELEFENHALTSKSEKELQNDGKSVKSNTDVYKVKGIIGKQEIDFIQCKGVKSNTDVYKVKGLIGKQEIALLQGKSTKQQAECSSEETEKCIKIDNARTAHSESRCSNVRGSLSQISSECRRCSELSTPSDQNISVRPKSKNSHKKSVPQTVLKTHMPHLQSGSVTLINKNNRKIKLTEFEPDIGRIVDQTEISRKIVNPNMMAGGEVVLEDFADIFKAPNYYADNPIFFGVTSNEMSNIKTSSMKKSFSENFINEKLPSGGRVIDTSSKGVSLPELCPFKSDSIYSPSPLLHLCRSVKIKSSSSSEDELFEDATSSFYSSLENSSLDSDLDNVFGEFSNTMSTNDSITTENGPDSSRLHDRTNRGSSSALNSSFDSDFLNITTSESNAYGL